MFEELTFLPYIIIDQDIDAPNYTSDDEIENDKEEEFVRKLDEEDHARKMSE